MPQRPSPHPHERSQLPLGLHHNPLRNTSYSTTESVTTVDPNSTMWNSGRFNANTSSTIAGSVSSRQKYNQRDSDDRNSEYSQDATVASGRGADLRRQKQQEQEQLRQKQLRQQQQSEEESARLRRELEKANHALAAKNSHEGMAAEERKKMLDDNMKLNKMISDLEARVSRIDGERKLLEDELIRSKQQSRQGENDAGYGQGVYDEYSNRENVRGGSRPGDQDKFGVNVGVSVQDHDKLCARIQDNEEYINYLHSELDRLKNGEERLNDDDPQVQFILSQIGDLEGQVIRLEARRRDTLLQESSTARRIGDLNKRIQELENRRNYLARHQYGGQNEEDYNDELYRIDEQTKQLKNELYNLNGFIATARRKLVEEADRLAQLRAQSELLFRRNNMLQQRFSTSEIGDYDETERGRLLTLRNMSEQQDIEIQELARRLEKSEEECKQLKRMNKLVEDMCNRAYVVNRGVVARNSDLNNFLNYSETLYLGLLVLKLLLLLLVLLLVIFMAKG